MVQKIDVKLNGTTVSFDGNMYSHRVDIENRLFYPNMVKKGHLSMMGFDEEKEAFDEINNSDIHWDDANPAENAYPAILRRYLKGKASKNMCSKQESTQKYLNNQNYCHPILF